VTTEGRVELRHEELLVSEKVKSEIDGDLAQDKDEVAEFAQAEAATMA
jgi:hypothetical protein